MDNRVDLMLDIVIPKTCKKWTRNGKSLHHSLLMGFDFWICGYQYQKFAGINVAIA